MHESKGTVKKANLLKSHAADLREKKSNEG